MHFGQIGCLSVVSSSRSSGGDVASLLHHRHTAFNNTSLFQMKIAMMMMMMMKYDYSHWHWIVSYHNIYFANKCALKHIPALAFIHFSHNKLGKERSTPEQKPSEGGVWIILSAKTRIFLKLALCVAACDSVVCWCWAWWRSGVGWRCRWVFLGHWLTLQNGSSFHVVVFHCSLREGKCIWLVCEKRRVLWKVRYQQLNET